MPTLSIYFGHDFCDEIWRGITHKLDCPADKKVTPEWIFGRNPTSDLTINCKNISRKHAVIGYSYASDRWSLADLNSHGGTFLNGKKLAAGDSQPLSIGDRFYLASNLITVVEDDEDTIGDSGPPTIADTVPLDYRPAPELASAPAPAPAPAPRGPWDNLHFVLSWVFGASTPLGVAYRLLLLALAVAVAIIAWQQ